MGKSSADKPRLRPRLRVMVGDEIALGPGRIDLLELIGETGSLRAAAKQMGISYMRAWQLVKYTNRCFREPIVEIIRGGSKGGGAILTRPGREVLSLYRKMENQCIRTTKGSWNQLRRRLIG